MVVGRTSWTRAGISIGAFLIFEIATSVALTSCSLFTDLTGLADRPAASGFSTDGGGEGGLGSPADASDREPSGPEAGQGCSADAFTFCESFDESTTPDPTIWRGDAVRGVVGVAATDGAPSGPNALRASTNASTTEDGWAMLTHAFPDVVPEEATLEQDMRIDAPSSSFQNLSTFDLRGPGNTVYSLQLSRHNDETLIEELVKPGDGTQTSQFSGRTTAMPTGRWTHVAIHFKKGTPGTYDLSIDGTVVITQAMRTDSTALTTGSLFVVLGLSYVSRAPSLALSIDNVKVSWR